MLYIPHNRNISFKDSSLLSSYLLNIDVHALGFVPKRKIVDQHHEKSCVDDCVSPDSSLWFLARKEFFRMDPFGSKGTVVILQLNMHTHTHTANPHSVLTKGIYKSHWSILIFFFTIRKKVCFQSYLSLISVCSVVFPITHWRHFNRSYSVKSFVFLSKPLPTEL